MNLLQQICTHMAYGVMNGKVDNAIPDSILSKVRCNVDSFTVWSCLSRVSKVVIETCYQDTNMEVFERNRMSKASFFYSGIEAPLVLDLMPAHMCFPRFPSQLFDQDNGTFTAKPNPYFNGTTEAVMNKTLALYMSLLKCYGMPVDATCNGILKSIVLLPAKRQVVLTKPPGLDAHLLASLKLILEMDLVSKADAHIEQFIVNFVSGMRYKSKQGFKEILYEGKVMLQNDFQKVQWSDKERSQPVEAHLFELSFESWPTSPAYMHHNERLRVYAKKMVNDVLNLPMPMTAKEHGIDCDSVEQFFSSPSGEVLVSAYNDSLFGILKSKQILFGDLLERYEALCLTTVN